MQPPRRESCVKNAKKERGGEGRTNRSKPSPLGRGVRDAMRLAEFFRWENILPDEGLQAAGTALRDVLLCKIPHQSPTAPASPSGKPKRRTNPVGVGASMTRLCLSLSLPQALTRQLPRQEEPMLVCA